MFKCVDYWNIPYVDFSKFLERLSIWTKVEALDFKSLKPRFGSVDLSVNVNLKWSCKLDYTWSKIQFLKFIIQLSYNVTVFFLRMVLLIKNFVTYLFIYIMKLMNLLTTLDLLLSLYPLTSMIIIWVIFEHDV